LSIVTGALILLTVGVVKVWRHVQRDGGVFSSNLSDKFAFVLGAAMGLFALALHSVVDFNLHIPANAIVAVTLMALLTSHWRFATERFWFAARWPGKLIATTLLLAMLGYLGLQTLRLGRENFALRRAATLVNGSLEQAAAMERAYAIEPHNGDNAYFIGENYRLTSLEGKADFAQRADQAIRWYQRGLTNNPFLSVNFMRWGMVLDFLDRHDEAEALFMKADELDPNGYFTSAHIGQHYVDAGDYASARPWLERSLFLFHKDNPVAETNLKIANDRLLEAAQDPLLQKLRERMQQQKD